MTPAGTAAAQARSRQAPDSALLKELERKFGFEPDRGQRWLRSCWEGNSRERS